MIFSLPVWVVVVIALAAITFIFAIGFIIGKKYGKSPLVGTLIVENREDREAFTWNFDTEFEDMAQLKELRIRVENHLQSKN